MEINLLTSRLKSNSLIGDDRERAISRIKELVQQRDNLRKVLKDYEDAGVFTKPTD